MRRAALLAAIAALCVLGLAPAAASSAGLARPAPADDLSAVQVVLDQRARALLARDKDAFMATVDPEASDAFRTSTSSSSSPRGEGLPGSLMLPVRAKVLLWHGQR